jgi:nucleoid-associated protein YgaU
MRRDVKIGMLIGSLLAVAAIVRLSTHPNLADFRYYSDSEAQLSGQPPDTEKNQPGLAGDEPKESVIITRPQEIPAINEEVTELTTEPDTARYNEPEKTRPNRIHTVVKGETLSDISQKYYGTASGWQKIYVANNNLLSSPDKLQPGMILIIPE